MKLIKRDVPHQTWWNRYHSPGEINDQPSKTMRDGYIPIRTRVLELLAAGEALRAYRREKYHYSDGEEPDLEAPLDPNVIPDISHAEIADISAGLEARKDEQTAVQQMAAQETSQQPNAEGSTGDSGQAVTTATGGGEGAPPHSN